MERKSVVTALAALAQESRLAIFRLLVQAGPPGLSAGKIGEALGIAPSSLSFHMKELAHAHLVASRQESRYIIYSANFQAMNELLAFLTENCCGGSTCSPSPLESNLLRGNAAMTDKRTFNVLFLCTGNSARSIMAEALLNALGGGRFHAWSAGSHARGTVHPLALERLDKEGIPHPAARSKSWQEFAEPGAPPLDLVITVCDNAAGEVCPAWPGQPITAHWGVLDPAAAEGSEDEQRLAFARAFNILHRRISLFTSLKTDGLERLALQQKVRDIAHAPLPEPGA